MKHFQIRSHVNDALLYEGRFPAFPACLEQAVREQVSLESADLGRRNLTNAMLDDAMLDGADFSRSNLTGANLSEAKLSGAFFNDSDLYNTCFALADLRYCRFDGAAFGGTDITGCDISHSVFSTLSCFSLEFNDAASMKNCTFANPDGLAAKMSAPPVVIKGASRQIVIIMDQTIKIGQTLYDYPEGVALLRNSGRKKKTG